MLTRLRRGTVDAEVSRVEERLGRRPEFARWGRRCAWAASVGCIAGCAQVIGVGGYGPESDATDDVLVGFDASDDEASMAFDSDGTDDTAAPVPHPHEEVGASRDASAEKPAMRDAAAQTSKDAGDSASADATLPPPVDASANGRADSAADVAAEAAIASAVDAQPPSPGACPSQCSGGCASGTCVIGVGGGGNVDCPANLPCDVQCHGDKACRGVINCAAGQPCQVECNGTTACTNWPLSGVTAMSLCVDCSGDKNQSATCRIACLGPGCNPSCD